tara:strand:- start:404 stop:592 length:189 start_codon:yes stop_codon:yes gene_type:complete
MNKTSADATSIQATDPESIKFLPTLIFEQTLELQIMFQVFPRYFGHVTHQLRIKYLCPESEN